MGEAAENSSGRVSDIVPTHSGARELAPQAPKVFISYSHDSEAHRKRVLALSERLRQDGIDADLDQYVNGTPDRGWPRWMEDGLDWADRVLVVCTDTYCRRFRGHEEPGKGKGVDWEGAIVTNELYASGSRTNKFVPIIYKAEDARFVPASLAGHTRYLLTSEDAYRELYDALLEQSGAERGRLGALQQRARDKGEPARFGSSPPERHRSGSLSAAVGALIAVVVAAQFFALLGEGQNLEIEVGSPSPSPSSSVLPPTSSASHSDKEQTHRPPASASPSAPTPRGTGKAVAARGRVDDDAAFRLGNECFRLIRADRWVEAKHRCQEALEHNPSNGETAAAIHYNLAVIARDSDRNRQTACLHLREARRRRLGNRLTDELFAELGCQEADATPAAARLVAPTSTQ